MTENRFCWIQAYINEYIAGTSDREIIEGLSKIQMAKSLHLVNKNDPTEKKVKNFAVLMFANKPEDYVPYAYVEMIIDLFGSKRKMESKHFRGSIWKQYYAVVNYINDNFLNTLVLREDGEAKRALENNGSPELFSKMGNFFLEISTGRVNDTYIVLQDMV